MYLKYLLEQSEESLLGKFFHLQLNEPMRGDWASKCLHDLDELNISEKLDEIRKMTHTFNLKSSPLVYVMKPKV